MGMGWFVRNATKLSILQGSKRTSLVNYGAWAESPFSACHSQCRAYAPSPCQLTKTRVSRTFRTLYRPRPPFSTSFSSSSSSSSSSFSSSPSKMGFIGWYLGMLESRPLLTKGVSSSIIFAAADLTSQMSTMSSSDSIDSIRTLRMAAYGIIILGPAQHMWFNFVAKVLPKRDVVTTLKKLTMGQILYGPVINTVFFSYNSILQGENGGEIVARLKRDLILTLLNGLIYWPMCDFLTYKVFPVHLQPLINSSFSFLWTIYLTYMAGLKTPDGT